MKGHLLAHDLGTSGNNQADRQKYLQVTPIFQRCYYALCDVYDQLAEVGA